ncbi:uncharacterized protein LOC115663416 [Syzygium oleosum]|uniref:uncharacterized protein LOC115663416 n=1 Tax=Syzygium oleosum TaxID=219896 RepID=UPI0024B99C87|nr:uncharacterized protein LOC115663416 [Syzygium oleosum]
MEIECSSAFNVLPNNIVVDILARVAANSIDDFFNAKISCKIFNKLAEEDYIYQQISINKIPDIMWRHAEEGNAFIKRCIKCNNLEALYMEGLKTYISLGKVELGMELLKRAAQIGHFGASYAIGLLLVGEDGELLEEGVRLLRQVYASGRVVECRKKFLHVMHNIWWKYASFFKKEPPRYYCPMETKHRKKRGWVCDINHYVETECEQCICRAEIEILCEYRRRP